MTADLEPVPQRATIVIPSTGEFDSRTLRIAHGLAARGHQVRILGRTMGPTAEATRFADGVLLSRYPTIAEEALPLPRAARRTLRTIIGWADVATERSDKQPRVRWLVGEAIRMSGVGLRARAQRIRAEADDHGADLYHAMGFLALPIARRLAGRAKASVIYDVRDLYAATTNISRLPRWVRALFRRQERAWAKAAGAVVTVNHHLASLLAREWHIPPPVIVLNGQPEWDAPVTQPDLIRAELGLAADTQIALYHGGFSPNRGIEQLAAAILVPGLEVVHAVFLGYGALRPALEAMAVDPSYGGRLHVIGAVPPDRLLEWIASANVAVMPILGTTLNHRLATPNKLFEALEAGLPVVVSDLPEMRGIVLDTPGGALGVTCRPDDPVDVARAIRVVLDMAPEELAALRSRCRRASRTYYAWEDQFVTLLQTYSRLTGRRW